MKTCKYKGKQYEMTWSGTTKFGEKAKLKFLDDPNHEGFWANLDAVSDIREVSDSERPKPKASRPKFEPPELCPHCHKPLIVDAPADDDDSIPF